MPGPTKSTRGIPWDPTLTDAELGALVRATIGIVRRELGHDADDETITVDIRVTAPRDT